MKFHPYSTNARALIAAPACILGSRLVSGCYQGAARSENLEILQTQLSASNRVATLVERSDHAALSGVTVFVFISDHPYSMQELRAKLYGLPRFLQLAVLA
jgi:hypothetical protein